VVEQVLDGFHTARGQRRGNALSYSFYVFDRGGEFEHRDDANNIGLGFDSAD
jgi:hypothetical protein